MAKGKTLELSIQIAGKVDKSLTNAIANVKGQTSSLARDISRMGTVGLAAMGTLAAGTVKAIADCTKAAEAFESDMADVVKYVGGLADEAGRVSDKLAGTSNGNTYAENYKEMSKALLDLSTQIPMTAEELTQLAASAGQSGKTINDLIQYDPNGNIKGFLKDVAMMGTAMDISADQAGQWAAKWEVAFDMDHDQIMVLSDQINYLGANSATTAAEIAQVVNDSAALGQIAGADAATTAALADAFLATGGEAGRAATSIKRIYTNMMKGSSATKAQQSAWKELGLTAEGVAKSMVDPNIGAAAVLEDVFTRISTVDKSRQTAIMSSLFGQWAIGDVAKAVNNMDAYTNALRMVQDAESYGGSMEREFIIKASTSEALGLMKSNALEAFKIDVGDSFLPVKKEFSLLFIDVLNGLRENMPEISKLAEMLAGLVSDGVRKLGTGLKEAMPYIQKALDYIVNNGEQVAKALGGIAAAFVGMKFAPAIDGGLGLISTLLAGNGGKGGDKKGGLLGFAKDMFTGGQKTAGKAGNAFQAMNMGAGLANNGLSGGGKGGIFSRMQDTAIGAIFGFKNKKSLTGGGNDKSFMKSLMGTAGQISDARNNGGLFGMAKGAVANSGVGKYFGGIGGGFANLKNTKIGGGIANGLSATGGVFKEIITGILGDGNELQSGLGLNHIAENLKMLGGIGGEWIGGKASLLKMNVANSKPGQAIGGMFNAVGGKVGPMAKGFAGFAGNALGNIGQFAGAGAGLLGNIWGPMLGGFGSLFAGAAPVIGIISGIIAVVSILGDHMEDIRGIVGDVFGEKGLAIFDGFMEKLQGIGNFISGLFQDGGVANALAPLREGFANILGGGGFLSTIFGGQETGLAAFDGVVAILQSIMGIVGQIVSFATTTVKPIIQDIFSFITTTVMPKIMGIFAEAAPFIANIISNIGNAVMTGMQIIGSAIQFVLPIVEKIISVIMDVGSVVIPALLAGFNAFSQGISNIMAAIQTIFDGLITFITGVFSGNWQQAWDGIKQIFGGAFDALVNLCKTPINAVVNIINGVIGKINGMGFTIPDWVPVIGGNSFTIDLPLLPTFAKGGFTNGPSIAGEAGTEAVISFANGVRSNNIDTWMQAGRMLGVNGQQAAMAAGGNLRSVGAAELKEIDTGNSGTGGMFGNMTFAPQITIQGNADQGVIDYAISEMREQFEMWFEQMNRRNARTAY